VTVAYLFDSSVKLYERYPELAALIPPDLSERGRRLVTRLAQDGLPIVSLHGDLTPSNILDGGAERGLVAIDPAPCLGDAGFGGRLPVGDEARRRASAQEPMTPRRADGVSGSEADRFGCIADPSGEWCHYRSGVLADASERVGSVGALELQAEVDEADVR
jgi:hypothetical protein